MEIYRNKYVKFIYDAKNLSINYYWSAETEYMSDEEYKKVMLIGIDYVKKFNPKNLLADQKNYKFIVTPDLQLWNAKETLPEIFKIGGIVKYAIIESDDFITMLSMKQTMEEDQNKKYKIMFFNNEKEAKEWFKK
ncbi:MAG: hypothetical protein B6I24_06590 [Bacteroidetes bacterium 4572_128]|nr:MAG: hypothetical protein B6I24_06590 [Bacteroidetes bacterium 4572_128]